jgi:hypothetical protein
MSGIRERRGTLFPVDPLTNGRRTDAYKIPVKVSWRPRARQVLFAMQIRHERYREQIMGVYGKMDCNSAHYGRTKILQVPHASPSAKNRALEEANRIALGEGRLSRVPIGA